MKILFAILIVTLIPLSAWAQQDRQQPGKQNPYLRQDTRVMERYETGSKIDGSPYQYKGYRGSDRIDRPSNSDAYPRYFMYQQQ